jgi:hypothetical protein
MKFFKDGFLIGGKGSFFYCEKVWDLMSGNFEYLGMESYSCLWKLVIL